MKKYDTLIFDLDGTLAVSKQEISKQMADLLSRASTMVNIVVITGGKFQQIKKQVIDQLTDEAHLGNIYILPTTGSAMRSYDSGNWTIVYELELTQQQKDRIIASLQNALQQASFDIDQSILCGEQIEDRHSQITLSALGQEQLPEIKKAWDPDYTKRKELVSLLSGLEDEFSVKFGGTTSIDITLAGIDKAYGINEFYDHVPFKIENGLFIGDEIKPGGNDFAATKTAIDTKDTSGPEETMDIINNVLEAYN
ncbi:HAD family hydrolase [Candidatus Campbellbacteria bacterium]|nr:HAD family hydrolase [Candidatus Campbellbacteria bacterium]|tara:strand:+ start:1521 stop:2279 length:759 start_codon:yes stop_codon:yes gene_type:complete